LEDRRWRQVIKKTRNAGGSWRDLTGFDVRGGAFTTTLGVDPTTPDIAYVASFKDGFGINGEILTEDGGRTWAEIGTGINNPRGDHRGVAFDGQCAGRRHRWPRAVRDLRRAALSWPAAHYAIAPIAERSMARERRRARGVRSS